ncbi:hypothetical protein [Anatilimnocola floriformis]|uniref:hypothetical protein n=1 Tax=Anatilimnocola floriformis TaxID=2948575 RepID=UPI0020C2558E|nr:hypothetical protein [Anatilimnocola floriformis]
MRFLIPAVLLCSLSLAGCGETVQPKTEDPAVIEKGRQEAIQNSNREMQRPAPPPGTKSVPAN